ncbi:MAG: rhomboid family intramembrane serine protease [Bacteroidota bacterium]
MTLLEEIKYTFNKNNNAVRKIIIVNVAVFLLTALVNVFMFFAGIGGDTINPALQHFMLPAALGKLLMQPWSIITYMFLHDGFFHILFNMLWLFWLGNLLHEYIGNQKVYEAYFGGGILGAILFLVCYNIFPVFQNAVPGAYALGASAGVLSVVVATATLLPNYPIQLLLFGNVRLKYIALVTVVLDVVSIPQQNPGGHIAHLGGALFGFLYIKYLYQEKHILPQWMRNLFTKKSKVKVHYRTTYLRTENADKPSQEEIDLILDKITKSGYDSLSKKEKEQLFKASND